MKKICIATFGDPNNPKVWSGTPSKIMNYFGQLNDIETDSINLKQMSGYVYKIFYALGRFLYRRGTLRDPLLYVIESNRFAKETYRNSADAYLFVAEHTINNRKNPKAKYYVYLDSLLRPHFEFDERPRKPGADWFLKHYEKNDKKCFLQYDGIMTQNEWSRDFLITQYGVPEDRIYNIGFGINANYYYGEKDYSCKQLMIVLRRGTEYIKGLYLLIDAFRILHEKDPEIKLAVFGTTAETFDGITYYENCPREEMLAMYQKSALYVMPNILEPNGITYLEALASKTPIVGLNRFAVPEFSGHGKYGFIAEEATAESLSDTILNALSDPERLKQMGENGQIFVRGRYNWDIVLEKMKKIMNL